MVASVLVVDDDRAFLALAGRVLGEIGVEVVLTAQDATTAVAEANAKHPEAALVDVDLPDRPGIELARDLATLPWAPRVVLTSADRDAVRAVDPRPGKGAVAFIPKEELVGETLQRLLTTE